VAIKFTAEQIKEIERLIKNTDLNQSEIAEAVNKKFPKLTPLEGHNVTHYAKKYFGIKTPKWKPGVAQESVLTPAYKKRFAFKDRKGNLLDNIVNDTTLKEKITADFKAGMPKEEIRLKYRVGGKGEKFLPSGIKLIGKETLNEVYEKWGLGRELGETRKVDVTSEDALKKAADIRKYYGNPKLSRVVALSKLGMTRSEVDKFIKRWDEANPDDPLFTRRTDQGIQYEGAGQERGVYQQKTKELQKFQTFLKKYINKPLRSGTPELAKAIKLSGLSPVGFQQNLQFLRRIYKGDSRPGFKIDNLVKNKINKFPLSTALTADVLLAAGYTPNQIKKLNTAQRLIYKMDTPAFLNQLEHKIPKSLATELLNSGLIKKPQYKELIGRITPVTTHLNQWKKQYDLQRLTNLKNYLATPMGPLDVKKFNQIENQIIKEAKRISGGYNIGKINILPNGEIDIKSPDELFTSKVKGIGTGSRALIDYYKNLKYHNNIAKAYQANKTGSEFGTLRAYLKDRGQSKMPLFDESITNDIARLSSSEDFTKWLSKNPDSALFKGLTKLTNPNLRTKLLKAGKVGGVVALASLIPSMLMAAPKREEVEQITEVAVQPQENLKYNSTLGSIVNTQTEEPADQLQVWEWLKENPVKTVAGTSLGFSAQEIPGAYKKARELGRGRTRSALGITGALKPVLTTFGTPAMTALFEVPFSAKRLEEGETMTEVLTDPLGPALGLTFMEPLSRGAGVIRGGAAPGIMGGIKRAFNPFDLADVGKARPGLTSKILRMGMSPRVIAGISRLGPYGMLAGAGLGALSQYQKYQNQEGMIYNLFNDE